VWRALPHERRLAAIAALALLFTLFLPWYQETVIARGTTASLSTVSASLTGWGAFSFVEAAVLLVAAAVLVLLFVRAEGAAFHVPGGDGGVVTAAGMWTCLLVVWRMFDKEGTTGHGLYETASGVEWGIFIALALAALLTYAGSRIKLANAPEPPLPGDDAPPRQRSQRPSSTEHGPRPAAPGQASAQAAAQAAAANGPAPAPRRRVRPSSLAEPSVTRGEATSGAERDRDQTRVMPAPEAFRVAPGPSESGRRRRRTARPGHPGLDFAELEEIRFDEPPEAPTVSRRAPDAEDPPTTRPDGTDGAD
jgi:hypothetical protein